MDLTASIASKSDQIDYQDFLPGPRTVTITAVSKGPSAEQPVEIAIDEFDRPWRPAKSMRRVLVAAWGADAETYVGRRVTLFGDATVTWAGAAVGGIRISHLSHIDKPLSVSLTITRGKRKPFTVQPLKEAPPRPAPVAPAHPAYDLDALDVDGLRALYMDRKAAGATPDELAEIQTAAQNKENK